MTVRHPAADPDQARFDAPAAAAELDRQLANLLDRGYPSAAGLTEDAFLALVEPLRARLAELAELAELGPPTPERVPLVLVVTKELVPVERSLPLTDLSGRPGFLSPDAADLQEFQPVEGLGVPAAPAYLLLDVQRGEEYLNQPPEVAVAHLALRRRTPLTVDEGISFITAYSGSLERNHCFSVAGSRGTDRRVPALWISKAAPRLGWCWAGAPHTWLGTASCAARVGPA